MHHAHSLLVSAVVAGLASVVAGQNCTLQFDMRFPKGTTAKSLDEKNKFIDNSNVLGKGLLMSTELKFPNVSATLFDTKAGTVPVEVTLNDKSIFAPSATNVQTGFRRLEMLAATNNGSDASSTGVKTLHFSVQKDTMRPLNLSHEYMVVFFEDAQFSNNMFNVRTGTLLDITNGTGIAKENIMMFGNSNNFKSPPALLYSTPWTEKDVHNFALALDFEKNTMQVFYSTNETPLKAVTEVVPNKLEGRGQFHFGMLKKPTGASGDITKNGFQESGINEGVIFGGIFMEDSSKGCRSLSP